MTIEPYKIEKVVISTGLGTRGLNQIEKVSSHMESLLGQILPTPQKPTICYCRKSNAKFKIRKGQPLGLKVTLRRNNAAVFLETLRIKVSNIQNSLRYNGSTLFYGVKDHRDLRLEKYNYEAPSYGFNIAIVCNITSSRNLARKIGPSKKRIVISEEVCRRLCT